MTKVMLNIIVRAFKIGIERGETFDDIAKSYPKLTSEDLQIIKERLNLV